MEKQIIISYQTQSIEKICKEFKIGKLKVKEILLNNGVTLKKKGGQALNKHEIEFNTDIENKKIRCLKCGKVFNDIENTSGAPISHIQGCYPEVVIPSKFKRTNYKKENGTYWHLQFFELIEKEIKQELNCPICNWSTTDLNNKTGSFTKHIEKNHDGVSKFLEKNKEYSHLFNAFSVIEFLNNEDNHIVCRLCGKKMKMMTNTHMKNQHGMSIEEYKLAFPIERIASKTSTEFFKKQMQAINMNMTPTWTSKGESEIIEFVKSLGIIAEKGKNRKLLNGKEIDVIIPEYKLCIEYDGLYYHTEKMGKNSTYHLNKTIECHKLGFNLIHIFEDEWETNKELIKSKIKYLLNKNNGQHFGARKVKIEKISSKIKSEFLNQNHLQGNDKSTIFYGAYLDNLLVGVMTFNSHRNMTKNKDNEYELSRFAIKQNYIVNGLGSKILKKFINEFNPESIVSFADRRWTPNADNNLYTKLGFELTNIVKPNYYYYNSKINRLKRFHKFGFGKQSLKKRYPHLDFNKSEKKLMSELGFDRIWDCGLFKYSLKIKKEV